MCELGAIDTLLSNFIKPLQGSEIATVDSQGNLDRIHCSLNINTETGRLSARRPNLQNQPALEKDRYKVSKPPTLQEVHRHSSKLGKSNAQWQQIDCLDSSSSSLLQLSERAVVMSRQFILESY